MDSRSWTLTKHLKKHDPALYCRKDEASGAHFVFRQGVRWETHPFGNAVLRVALPSHHFILALTDTWTTSGRPIEWGIEPVLNRIKEIDLWRDDNQANQVIEDQERAAKSRDNNLHSETEAFLKDFRRPFAKEFNDINTSTLEKVDPRRKHAYRKSG